MDRGLLFSDLTAALEDIEVPPSDSGAPNGASSPESASKHKTKASKTPWKPYREFDFEAFLNDQQIAFNVKQDGDLTMLRFDSCWYDSSHGKNQSAIMINPKRGIAVYKCFHESCGKKPWDEAIKKIIGDEPLPSKYFNNSGCLNFTYDDLLTLIENNSDYKTLTVDILQKIASSSLSEADGEHLIRLLSKKAKVSVAALRKDAKNFSNETDGKDYPYSIALKTIDELGSENILMTTSHLWHWDESGVWRIIDDRTIKQAIHRNCVPEKLTKGLVDSVLDLIKTEIYREYHRFDSDQSTINCLNGELNWDNDQWHLVNHCRDNHRTTQIPITYDPLAVAPKFDQFLDEIFQNDADKAEKQLLIKEFIGYSLTTSTQYEKFLMLFGPGANGKSVLMSVVAAMVGPDNVTAVQPSQFGNKFQRAHMHNKLLNLVTEIAEGYQIDDAELKAIVSGELIAAEHKNKPPFDFKPFATCWFGTNHMPHTRDFSDALFRRAMIITCNRIFKEHEQDRNLTKKLLSEKSGILNVALHALAGVYKRGHFTEPASMAEAKHLWKVNADQVHQFVLECCDIGPGINEETGMLYSAFTTWARQCGLHRVCAKNSFSQRITRVGQGIELQPGSNGGARKVSNVRLNEYFCKTYAGKMDNYDHRRLLEKRIEPEIPVGGVPQKDHTDMEDPLYSR